jgi:Trypsin-like peptidase domain
MNGGHWFLQPNLHTQRFKSAWWLCTLVVSFLWMSVASSPALLAQSAEAKSGRERALRATVLILAPDDAGELLASGSGTVMAADQGYILTNYHVVGDTAQGKLHNQLGLAVIGVLPPDLRGAPVLKYRATVVAGDPKLDLAVLKITALFDDPKAVLPKNLGLTTVPRADSDALLPGDQLYVLGYPGLGGNTLTLSQGLVSGFLDEDNDGVQEWIKTDAEINQGNSGGLATNPQWEFIGVPSVAVTDEAVSGKISRIRTGNVALQYYESVLLRQNRQAAPASGSAQVTGVQFGEALNRRDEIINPAVNFASKVRNIYAAFDFAAFRDGQTLTYHWYYEGQSVLSEAFAWNEGEQGHSWLNLYDNRGLADGFYELELLLDNNKIYRGGVTVGAPPRTTCQFGPITFATQLDESGKPVDPARIFSNATTIYAIFPVTGMQNGMPWKAIWYYEGQKALEDAAVWDQGSLKTQWVSVSQPATLPVGTFKVELYCNNSKVQSGEFAITAQPLVADKDVNVVGRVYDADNQRVQINGALVVFLLPGITVNQWTRANYTEEMIAASGVSNPDGSFQLNGKVTPGQQYSVVVVHEEYTTIKEDGFEIPADSTEPYELEISLNRK